MDIVWEWSRQGPEKCILQVVPENGPHNRLKTTLIFFTTYEFVHLILQKMCYIVISIIMWILYDLYLRSQVKSG